MANEKIIKQIVNGGLGTLNVYKANNGFIVQDPRVGGIFTLNGEGDLYQVGTQIAEEIVQEVIAALKGNTVGSIYVVIKEKPLLVFDEKNPHNAFFGPLGMGLGMGSKFAGDKGAEFVMKTIRTNEDDRPVVNSPNVYGPQESAQFIIIPSSVQDDINFARSQGHRDTSGAKEENLGDGKFRVKGK